MTQLPINPVEILQGSCPVPRSPQDRILMSHGGGGRYSADLLHRVFLPAFGNATLNQLEDQAVLKVPEMLGNSGKWSLATTTDSYVVRPLFFPGGDIGKLAVHGTINDLAVGGATPLWLTAAFILEEGLSVETLQRVVQSMQHACRDAEVQIVTGDTKVVERGHGDQIYITTTGIGLVPSQYQLSIRNARPGDRIIVSGTIGDHGIAIMSVREGLEFETVLESDTAPLHDLTRSMLDVCPAIRAMRDPTRGGVSSTLNEVASAAGFGVHLIESELPIRPEVQAACEMLGLDPLYVANEGKLIAIVPEQSATEVLATMRQHPLGRQAAVIGTIVEQHPGMVVMQTRIGGERVVSMLSGEQLPRIC